MKGIENRRTRRFALLFLLAYLITVVWYTLLKRSPGYYPPETELFWSYKRWIEGDWKLGWQVLGNLAMFLPFGVLVPACFLRRKNLLYVLLPAALFSLGIEVSQRVFLLGVFEWDDLFSNCLGALLGWELYCLLSRRLGGERRLALLLSLGGLTLAACLGMLFIGQIQEKADNSPRLYCFQVDDADLEGIELRLEGFLFQYEDEIITPNLSLRSTRTGKKTPLSTEYGLARSEVNDYFRCERDYTDTGFRAVGTVDPETEYELILRWSGKRSLSAGVYLKGGELHFAPESEATPELDELFIKEGWLRLSRPDFHCWVYQYDGALYWITEEGFAFEDDGTTYIQYQLWTTQTEKLPEKRLANGHLWDNIGGYFEEYELEGNFGPYRVMKRELPTDYAVTAVVTGYYKNEEWIWKNYFRPIYTF